MIENEEKLHNYLTYLTQVINEYDRQQSAIIEVISDSKRNFISHELFTASQIEHQVEIITQQVGTEFQVPMGIDVYSVSKISVYRLKNQYVFKISIPLLKSQRHKLYEISRIPTIHGDEFLWIDTSNKYLLTTLDRKLYQFLSNVEDCVPYKNKRALICDKPTYWFTSNKEDCVWEIFNHIPRTACKITREKAQPFVIGLNQNQFVFVIKDTAKVTIICKDSVNHDWLRGEGLLALEPQCYLTGENIHLNTRIEYDNSSEIVIPNVDSIKEWIMASDKQNNMNLTAITLDGVQNITELQRSLNETKANLKLFKVDSSLSNHDITHYSLYTITLSLIVVYFMFKKNILPLSFKERKVAMPIIDSPLHSSLAPENVASNNSNQINV